MCFATRIPDPGCENNSLLHRGRAIRIRKSFLLQSGSAAARQNERLALGLCLWKLGRQRVEAQLRPIEESLLIHRQFQKKS